MRSVFGWLVLGLGGCTGPPVDTGGEDPDALLAEELFEAISSYRDWPQHPDFAGVQVSDAGHGPTVQLWLNTLASEALVAGDGVPDGGILVKEGYGDEVVGDLSVVTVMWKRDGYDPDHADWFWARFDPETDEATHAGQESACYSCHESLDEDGDYLLFLGG